MNASIITPFEWFFLLLFVFITIMSFYQACVNLYYGKVSRFSIDAILVFLFIKFGNERARKRAQAFTKNVDRIMLFGVYAFLSFIGGVYGVIVWLQRITR